MQKLREGYTTGSCAAAAALASCLWQRDGECPRQVELLLPAGRLYRPEILAHEPYCCGVLKDGGDDPDCTTGMEVQASAKILDAEGKVTFIAGEGVGTVTRPGLKLPVGEPAINPVPRAMIEAAVRSVFGSRAARVTVTIPGGREKAMGTFNPRLGIEGGLSVLGTTGVVRPMSEEALKEALALQLKMHVAAGRRRLAFTFGNQGEEMLRALDPEAHIVQVSNELGFMLDEARSLGVSHILLGGHIGKLSKVAVGAMQTHSRTVDGRREAIITQLALLGAPTACLQEVNRCVTTDAMADVIERYGMSRVWDRVADAAARYCELRVHGEIPISVILFGAGGRVLGRSGEAER